MLAAQFVAWVGQAVVEDYEPGRYCLLSTAVEFRDCSSDTGAGFDVS